jgi:cobaltochelatase CobN
MHLLSAQAGALQQEGEAIDLGQSPASIIFASAADSELALLAGAVDRAGARDVRLANLLRLSHNLSVDLWIEKTVRYARLIVVRLLGGAAYWTYGVEQLEALKGQGVAVALLPGDATPDPILQQRSTVSAENWTRLHSLFTAGGPENADAILALMRGEATAELKPFPRFGYWHPQHGIVDALPESELPNIPLLFYRAALEGGGTATVEALIAEIARQGLHPMPLLVSTLKEAACVRFVQAALAAHPPSAVLNMTGFALGLDGLDAKLNPFAGVDAPVIQLVQGGRAAAQWAADMQAVIDDGFHLLFSLEQAPLLPRQASRWVGCWIGVG